ncbi:hypothetical protein D3C73_1602620 [compost metagenome]
MRSGRIVKVIEELTREQEKAVQLMEANKNKLSARSEYRGRADALEFCIRHLQEVLPK